MAAQDSRDAEHGVANDAAAASAVSIDLTRKESPDDRVAQFVAEHQDYPPMTPEMEKRIKKKIDAWIIPLVRSPPSYHGLFTSAYALHLGSLHCYHGSCRQGPTVDGSVVRLS